MMKRNKTLLVLLLVISLISMATYAKELSEKEGEYQLKTIRGNLRVVGSDTRPLYMFKADDGENYILWEGVIDEINKLKQYTLIVSGKLYDNVLIPLNYNIVNNRGDKKSFIGKVYSSGNDIYLLTDDLKVIKLVKGFPKELNSARCLVRGDYTEQGDFAGEMDVMSFVVLVSANYYN